MLWNALSEVYLCRSFCYFYKLLPSSLPGSRGFYCLLIQFLWSGCIDVSGFVHSDFGATHSHSLPCPINGSSIFFCIGGIVYNVLSYLRHICWCKWHTCACIYLFSQFFKTIVLVWVHQMPLLPKEAILYSSFLKRYIYHVYFVLHIFYFDWLKL